jgi:hypothetical protein
MAAAAKLETAEIEALLSAEIDLAPIFAPEVGK